MRRPEPSRFLSTATRSMTSGVDNAGAVTGSPRWAITARCRSASANPKSIFGGRSRSHHPDGHAVAVRYPSRDLDGMADGVAVVEHGSDSCLAKILTHNRRLDGDGTIHDEVQRGVDSLGFVTFDEVGIGNQPGFQRLRSALTTEGERQVVQYVEINDDSGGMVEGTDEVLARHVDPRLATDRSVDRTEERGRHQHRFHTSQIGGGNKPGDIGDGTAADAEHRVAPGQTEADEPAIDVFDHSESLGIVPVWNDLDGSGQVERRSETFGKGSGRWLSKQLPPDVDRRAAAGLHPRGPATAVRRRSRMRVHRSG